MHDAIRLIRHPLSVGGYLAQLTLNAPQRLNALNLDMVQRLLHLLQVLARDDEAVAVFLDGVGDRGFCAGGDVRQLRDSVLDEGAPARAAERFFEVEYRVDYLIHTFPKPIICWAHGAVMGGGLGLLAGASHRIATPSSRIAMPEITIGLYPDVGATWFLQRMPGRSGLFCALTGVSLNAGDALYSGLADYLLPDNARFHVLVQLTELDWSFDTEADRELLTTVLTDIEAEYDVCLPESHLKLRRDLIDQLCADPQARAIDESFAGLHGDDAWLNAAGQSFQSGSASTACIVLEQYTRGESLSLAEAFQLEMAVSVNRVKDPEFIEGVRAQLIDKDRRPQWRYARLGEVPEAVIQSYFESPWLHNPLRDLP